MRDRYSPSDTRNFPYLTSAVRPFAGEASTEYADVSDSLGICRFPTLLRPRTGAHR